ncbi:MAG: hypothetical protein WCA64_01505 [Gallionella sp.]
MQRSLLTGLPLILAMLLAQMGSLAHGISHIHPERSQGPNPSLPHDKYCAQCAAYAQIGGLVGSSPVDFAGSESFDTLSRSEPVSFDSATFVAFAARGPPDPA